MWNKLSVTQLCARDPLPHKILMENLSEPQCSVHEDGFGASGALRYTCRLWLCETDNNLVAEF
jgi:hypothetical protein